MSANLSATSNIISVSITNRKNHISQVFNRYFHVSHLHNFHAGHLIGHLVNLHDHHPNHHQALTGSRISIPGFFGTGFCKIPGSRDLREIFHFSFFGIFIFASFPCQIRSLSSNQYPENDQNSISKRSSTLKQHALKKLSIRSMFGNFHYFSSLNAPDETNTLTPWYTKEVMTGKFKLCYMF